MGLIQLHGSPAALVHYGEGLGGLLVIESSTSTAEAQSLAQRLPQVTINGVKGVELATALGTAVRFTSNSVTYVVAGSQPSATVEAAARAEPVSEPPPLEARGLVKRYGQLVAVDHVDLTVGRGDVYGFLGPQG